jgi:ribonuclease HI
MNESLSYISQGTYTEIMNKVALYAVANGRKTGIFDTWDECSEQVKGFRGAIYKKFTNAKDANDYIDMHNTHTHMHNTHTHTHTNETIRIDEPFIPDYYVYTDGACANNGRKNARAGYGIYFGENDTRNRSAPIVGDKQTNNVAELTAILKTFSIIENDIACGKKIMIMSDSSYALRCIGDYGKRCYDDGWKKDVPHKELIREAYELYRNCPNVKCMYIAAHTSHTDIHSMGNDNADKLANRAIGLDACPYNTNVQISQI